MGMHEYLCMLKVNNINFSFISKICEAGELQVQTIMPLKSIKYPSNAFPWLPTTSDNLKPQNCCLRANSTYEIKLLHRSRAKVREWVRARSCNGNAISTELSMISATSERPQWVSERARIFNFHKKVLIETSFDNMLQSKNWWVSSYFKRASK